MTDLPPVIECRIQSVTDADTVRAMCGGKPVAIRLAGISALERSGRCNSAPDCPTMGYAEARRKVERIALGHTYRFKVYGKSGRRIVADNMPLRCAIIRSGAAVTWWRYHRKYGLEGCDGR